MSPNGEQIEMRRREILAAALIVFDANGYAATTMDAVAAEAGISKGSIYNYFKSKQDLFFQLFSQVVSGAEAAAAEVLGQSKGARQKLEEFLDDCIGRVEQHRRLGRLVLEFWMTAAREQADGQLASWFKDMYSRWRNLIATTVTEGIASGEFSADADPDTTAALILSMLDGIKIQMILGYRTDIDDEKFYAAMKRTVLSALVAQPVSQGGAAEDTR